MPERFEHHARTVTVLTALSRVTGLLRDASLSRIFGAGSLMDAFWFAFLIPNLFRRLFGEGALSAAFLPVYSQLEKSDPAIARQLATLTVSLMAIVLGGITLLGEAVLFSISGAGGHQNVAIWLMMILLPYMPLVCLVAVMGAMLQVHRRFGPTAAAPILLNACIVATAVGMSVVFRSDEQSQRIIHIGWVAGSVILAGMLQVIWSLWALRGQKWWAGGMKKSRDAWPAMQTVGGQAWPMFIGLGVFQINTFLDGLIASYPTTVGSTIFGYDFPLDLGAMASLSFAQRLYEFPLGVFGIAIATAIFPSLARAVDEHAAFTDLLRRGLRMVVYIGLPASAGLILVREPLTAAVLQGGDFTASDTNRVAFILLGYASAVWAYSMIHVLTRAFYAKGDSRTPVKVAVGMVGLNLTLNCILIWTPLKEAGLAWSTAFCAIVQVLLLVRFIRRYADHVIDREVKASWLRTMIVTVVMSFLVWTAASLMPEREPTWSWAVIQLAILVPVGAIVAVLASIALRMPELKWALGKSTMTNRQ